MEKIKTQEPKVVLINWTPNPIETMCCARQVMQKKVPDSLEDIRNNPVAWLGMSIDKYVDEVLLKDGMPTFLEYVNLVFKLENVSRGLTHQLVRHRIGFSYSQQSMRCVSAEDFADRGMFYLPNTVEDKVKYIEGMKNIQLVYNEALNKGMSVQDARGFLPTNILTTITFSCSLRAFIGMINKRLCFQAQEEWKKVADLMLNELYSKLDRRIEKWIGPPCKFGYCVARGDNERKYNEGKLTGKANTEYCCPNFIKLFKEKK